MAGVRIHLVSLSSQLPSCIRLRGFARQSWVRRSLSLSGSRAFSSCAFGDHLHRPAPRFLAVTSRVALHTGQALHKASPRESNNKKKKNKKNVPTTASIVQTGNQPQTPASPNMNLATTLKSKLKLDTVRHENIYNIPNFLTLSRLLATPAIGYLIIHNHHLYAFSLFAYAAFSDLLDGWIARRWKLQTVVGSVVDPMADKFLMTTLVTCLAVNGSLSMPLFVLILGRDVSLAISALYYRYASLPAPKTMARYWDFSLPSAEVHPTNISKFNTFLQLSLLGTLLCTNLLHDPSATSSAAGGLLLSIQELLRGEEGVKIMIQGMSAIVASTTIYSGLEYTWSKKAVVILGGNKELKRKQGLRGRMIMASCFGSFIALAVYLWYRENIEKDGANFPDEKASS